MTTVADQDADYCPESPGSSASSHRGETQPNNKRSHHVSTADTPPMRTLKNDDDAVTNQLSTDQPPHPPHRARVPLPLERPPARDLHQGWDPSSIAMAKCDMCSRAGRGVVHKCSQCKLSVCKECCEGGKLEGDSRHRLDPATVSWVPPPKALPSRRPREGGRRRRIIRLRATRRETSASGSPRLSPVQSHALTRPSTSSTPAMGIFSTSPSHTVNERQAPQDYTTARETSASVMESCAPTAQPHQQTDTYAGNAAAATLAAMSTRDSYQAPDIHPDPRRSETASHKYSPTSHAEDKHHYPPTQRRVWPSPERATDHDYHTRYQVQETTDSNREPCMGPIPGVRSHSRAGNNQIAHGPRMEDLPRLPPISTLLGPDTHISHPEALDHRQRPYLGQAHRPPSPQYWGPHEYRSMIPAASYLRRPPPPDHEEPATLSYVESLSRRLVHDTYHTYHHTSAAPPLEVCLRNTLDLLWTRILLPSHGTREAFRLLLTTGYSAATQLGLDPLRNSARDWLQEMEEELYGTDNESPRADRYVRRV